MSQTVRCCAALLGLCALLFANLSVAAYACPGAVSGSQPAATAMPDGCPDRDTDQPNLCKAHCATGQQQTTQAATDLPPLPLVHGLIATLFVLPFARSAPSADAVGATLSRNTAPPITIRNCCFRL